jgi:chemotaxis protein methyltransferase CheR
VRAFLTERTGLSLSGPQVRRLDERLTLRSRGLTPQQYLNLLKSPAGALELEELINAVVVHKTDLFRDEVQLSAFRAQVLAPLVDGARRPLRLWSAGCATGEEVATLLVMLAELGADPGSTVLGTDISEQALRRAQGLAFAPEQVRRVPPVTRERFFVEAGARVALIPALRGRASFQLHNLMDTPYPVPASGGGFDVIFCRNVLIYFTPEAFQRTVEALAASLAPGGTLVLSASEPLLRLPPSLRVLRGEQAFFYVRKEEDPGPRAGAPVLLEGVGRKRDSGRFAAIGAKPPTAGPSAPFGSADPASTEADLLFACVLDGASSGTPDDAAERDLRRCLALDPDHAAARYLLGLLLEQGGRSAEAAAEYRRALQALEAGRARPVPFFLNPARLQVACAHAAERLETAGRGR